MVDCYLSVNQVCARIHRHRNTVEKWLRSGKLKGYRLGKEWRVKPEDVDALYEEAGK